MYKEVSSIIIWMVEEYTTNDTRSVQPQMQENCWKRNTIMQPGPRDLKILPEMHDMPLHRKEMVLALPSDSESESESEEELEYPGRGATFEEWDEFDKQQIQFVKYQFDNKVKELQKASGSQL